MPQATISTTREIKTSNFGVLVTLDMPIEDLPKSIVTLRAIFENGITGVDFSVSGAGTTWNLMFVVPSEKDGTFEVSIAGEVTVVGESEPEAVSVLQPLVVRYDTTTAVTAEWGDVVYDFDGLLMLPITFGEEITLFHKSDFTIETVIERDAAGKVKYSQPAGLVSGVDIDALISLVLYPFQGVGPLTITNDADDRGAGVFEVIGTDENGNPQTETLTFAAGDAEKTTVNNYISPGLMVRVTTAFPSGTRVTVRVDAVPVVWEVIERYWLSQEAANGVIANPRTFNLYFQMLADVIGAFTVNLTGYVYKTADTIRDDVQVTPKQVRYDTSVPDVDNYRVVQIGERINMFVQYTTKCTLNDPVRGLGYADATYNDFLDYAGQNLGPANFYRHTDVDVVFPREVDLQVDSIEAGDVDWTNENLQEIEATLYLIQWRNVPENEEFNVTLKDGFVRGPARDPMA